MGMMWKKKERKKQTNKQTKSYWNKCGNDME